MPFYLTLNRPVAIIIGMDRTGTHNPLDLADSLTMSRRLVELLYAKHVDAMELPEPEDAKALRLSRGLSLRELAGLVGVTHMAISRYERAERKPSGPTRARYAAALAMLAEVAD